MITQYHPYVKYDGKGNAVITQLTKDDNDETSEVTINTDVRLLPQLIFELQEIERRHNTRVIYGKQ